MKKMFVVFLLIMACFSVVSAQTLEQEIQQLEKCCAHKNDTIMTNVGVLDSQKIQQEIDFIFSVVSQKDIKNRMLYLDIFFSSNGIDVYWLRSTRLSISEIWITSDGKLEAPLVQHHIKKGDLKHLQALRALQNMDRTKFVQELKGRLCQ